MTVRELAKNRYGGEFVFTCGGYVGSIRFVLNCFDPIRDWTGDETYSASCHLTKRSRRESVEVNGNMSVAEVLKRSA